MLIDANDSEMGNRAVASVLLLYYHLLREGGIVHGQTVYIDSGTFDGFDYLDVDVASVHRAEIDQQLLREGAVICVLCHLNDMIEEFEHDFIALPFVRRILAAHAAGKLKAIPEADAIARALLVDGSVLDRAEYEQQLTQVFNRYVVARFRGWLPSSE